MTASARIGRGLALSSAAWFVACFAATPRIEDASAPRDFREQVAGADAECHRLVELVEEGARVSRPYDELAMLSATCSPGARSLCERRLKESACARGADAVLLVAPVPGALPPGSSGFSQIAVSGRAVRWR